MAAGSQKVLVQVLKLVDGEMQRPLRVRLRACPSLHPSALMCSPHARTQRTTCTARWPTPSTTPRTTSRTSTCLPRRALGRLPRLRAACVGYVTCLTRVSTCVRACMSPPCPPPPADDARRVCQPSASGAIWAHGHRGCCAWRAHGSHQERGACGHHGHAASRRGCGPHRQRRDCRGPAQDPDQPTSLGHDERQRDQEHHGARAWRRVAPSVRAPCSLLKRLALAHAQAYSWPSHCKRYLESMEQEKRFIKGYRVRVRGARVPPWPRPSSPRTCLAPRAEARPHNVWAAAQARGRRGGARRRAAIARCRPHAHAILLDPASLRPGQWLVRARAHELSVARGLPPTLPRSLPLAG